MRLNRLVSHSGSSCDTQCDLNKSYTSLLKIESPRGTPPQKALPTASFSNYMLPQLDSKGQLPCKDLGQVVGHCCGTLAKRKHKEASK